MNANLLFVRVTFSLINIIFEFAEPATPAVLAPFPQFLRSKKKKGKQRKKERASKQKLLKGCHQGQNVTVLAILERLELKSFSSALI